MIDGRHAGKADIPEDTELCIQSTVNQQREMGKNGKRRSEGGRECAIFLKMMDSNMIWSKRL